jgi:[ribosomal protein S18]-alanine N-acetyltransferase
MTAEDARQIAQWQYEGRSAVYNLPSAEPLLDDLADYLAVTSASRLVGFCCTDDAARVPGMSAEAHTLDVGFGMEPALVGQGHGHVFGGAVLVFVTSTHPGMKLRAVVQDWNQRSARLLHRLGFVDVGELTVLQAGEHVRYRVVTHSPVVAS